MRFPNSHEKLEIFTLSTGVADMRPFSDALVGSICGFGKGEGAQVGPDCNGGRNKRSVYFDAHERLSHLEMNALATDEEQKSTQWRLSRKSKFD